MNAGAASSHLAQQARRLYADHVIAALPAMASAVLETTRTLLDKPAVSAVVLMRRDLFKAMERAGGRLAARHRRRPVQDAGPVVVGRSRGRSAVAGHRRPVAGRRRHHRARNPHVAPGAGHHGPRVVGVRRPALAAGVAGAALGARRPRLGARPRAGARRARGLAQLGHEPGRLARVAAGGARGVRARRRGGLPRGQPLADRAAGVARGRPAAVDPPLARRQHRRHVLGRLRRQPRRWFNDLGARRPGWRHAAGGGPRWATKRA